MNLPYLVVYIESLILCILLLLTLFILNIKYGKPANFRFLAIIYLLTILSAILDIVWVLIDGNPFFVYFAYVLHDVYLLSFTFISLLWFCYCEKFYPFKLFKRHLYKFLFFLPAFIIMFITITSPLTKIVYYIDENFKYVRGDGYFLLTIGYVYLIIASILSGVAIKKSVLSSKRNLFTSFILFALSPILLGLLSIIVPPGSLPTMQFSIFFSLLLIFIKMQNGRITIDSLTGLPNRYALDNVIQEKMNHHKKDIDDFYILMGDINSFKSINDNFGHMEGDRTLKIVAGIMDEIAKKYQTRATRMGGDEFAIVVDPLFENIAVDIKNQIQTELQKHSKEEKFEISMSIGIATYKKDMSLTQFLEAADKSLYQEKRALVK